jgi:hypothetical protein
MGLHRFTHKYYLRTVSKLKSIGRNVRRLRKQIAAMDPKKTYRVYEGKKHLTLTGQQWKNATKPINHEQVDTDLRPSEEGQAQDPVLDIRH